MLETKGLSVFYGRHRALEDVSIRVDRGEICVILGANGAGKSTLLKAIAGLVRAEPGGTVSIDRAAINALPSSRIVEHGVALVPEAEAIFGELTVRENLELGAYPQRARRGEAESLKRVYALFPVLAERRGQVARTMSGGEQKMLAIGRALMSAPDILMLDEPSLGLSPLLTGELFKALKAIGASGTGILLVEQNANQSLKIADRGYLLENGHIVGEDSAIVLANDPAVRRAYLGGETGAAPSRRQAAPLAPAVPLTGNSAAEIASHAGALATRAGAIFAAHRQSETAAAPRPSAFAASHDGSPAVHPGMNAVPSDALALGRMAGALAAHAAAVHAAHILETRRLRQPASTPAESAPTAPPPSPTGEASPPPSELTRMAERIVAAAHANASSCHPPAGVTNGASPAFGEQRTDGTEDETPPSPRAINGSGEPLRLQALSDGAEELAARAAAIQSRHLAASREAGALSHAFATRHQSEDQDEAHARHDKHKKGKKKSRKHHDV